jgi:hypothetical protein
MPNEQRIKQETPSRRWQTKKNERESVCEYEFLREREGGRSEKGRPPNKIK